jgi:hypothetical protein
MDKDQMQSALLITAAVGAVATFGAIRTKIRLNRRFPKIEKNDTIKTVAVNPNTLSA